MKIIVIYLFFVFSCVSINAQQEFYNPEFFAVCKNGKWGVQSIDGEIIYKHKYDYLTIDNFNYIKPCINNFCGIYDEKGEILPIKFESIKTATENIFITQKNGKYGLCDTNNIEILPHKYKSIICTNKSYFILNEGDKFILYNIAEKSFGNSYKKIVLLNKVNNVYNIKTETGFYIYIPDKNYSSNNCDSIVKLNQNLYLLIEKNNRHVLQIKDKLKIYKTNNFFYKELKLNTYAFKLNDTLHLVNAQTNKQIEADSVSVYSKMFNRNDGRITISDFLEKDSALQFAYVFKKGNVGIINRNLDIVIAPQYHKIFKLKNNLFKVIKQNKTGLINKEGEIKIPVQYDLINYYDSCYYVINNSKTGLYSNSFELLLKPEYESLTKLKNNYYKYSISDKYGIVETGDNIISPAKYNSIKFTGKGFIVGEIISNINMEGYLDKAGKKIIPPEYNNLWVANQDILIARVFENRKSKTGLISITGEKIITPVYNSIIKTEKENVFKVLGYNVDELSITEMNILKETDFYVPNNDIKLKYHPTGYINIFGEILLDTFYYEPQIKEDFERNTFEVKYDSTMLLVSMKENGMLYEKTEYINYLKVNEFKNPKNFKWVQKRIQQVPYWGLYWGKYKVLKHEYDNVFESGYGENYNAVKQNENIGIVNMKTGKLVLDPIYKTIRLNDFNIFPLAVVENTFGRFALIDREYKIVKKGFGYIGNLKNEFIRVNKGGKYIEYEDENKISRLQFLTVENPIYTCQRGKWGIVDKSSFYTVDPQYSFLEEFHFGGFVAQKDKKWGKIGPYNEVLIDFIYEDIKLFVKENIPQIQSLIVDSNIIIKNIPFYKAKRNGKWGVIDTIGNIIVPFNYSNIKLNFDDTIISFITVKYRRKKFFGYVNNKGHQEISPNFIKAEQFKNGFARVQIEKGKWLYIDTAMNILKTGPFKDTHDFFEGVAAVKANNKWGFINETGKFVIEPQYSKVGDFSEGLAPVYKSVDHKGKKRNTFVFINKNNEVVLKKGYRYCSKFNNGLSIVKDKNYGLIDIKGRKVLSTKYKSIKAYPESGVFKISKNNKKYAFINNRGVKITPFSKKYRRCNFSEGLCNIKSGPNFQYINTEGEMVFSVKADYAENFKNGKALIKEYRFYKFIDKEGNETISFDLVFLKRNLLSKDGKSVINPRNQISDDLFLFKQPEYHNNRPVYKKMLVDSEINPTVFCAVDEYKEFSEGFAVFGVNKIYGIYDSKGNKLVNDDFIKIEKVLPNFFKLISLSDIHYVKIKE